MATRKSSKRRPPRRSKVTRAKKVSLRTGDRAFPVVGMGASAGGLKAFEQFFANMSADTGAAFVLVSHLDPSHVSMLPELLRKYTKMAVVQATDGMQLSPNRLHVIPPNSEMVVMQGKLLLKKPWEPRGLRLPIDTFLKSLAEDRKNRAVCIILSGNGTDGTLGLKAIKAELGFALVQDPNTAEYDSMPRSAIGSGLVDCVLAPDKMPVQLMAYVRHFVSRRTSAPLPGVETHPDSLARIFQLIRARTAHDFSAYKKNTLCRRIERRMSVHQIERLPDYVDYIERNPQEAANLFKELLIGVTNFFRDPQAFSALGELVRSQVLAAKPKDSTLRVWIPGCSSGEEVYSIAILLRECMDRIKKFFKVQIFATDIDSAAIDAARAGLYPAGIAADIGPERLRRFFVAEGAAFRIRKEIREMAVFAIQDVLKDPPFTKLDLLSCRNLLIYLDADAQKKLLPLIHYALNPDGLLFLGSSESIGGFTNLFTSIDRKWKIFKRRAAATLAETAVQFPSAKPTGDGARTAPSGQASKVRADDFSTIAQKLLVEKFAPPCVLTDSSGNIVYTHGRTGRYLELAQGRVNLNVLDMVRQGLSHELAAAMRKATSQKRSVVVDALRIRTNSGFRRIIMTVTPVARAAAGLLMVAFEELSRNPPKPGQSKASLSPSAARRVSQMEHELKDAQAHLQTTIEELETSNEELKSSNEELQSTNEELQSTNEEMETSKEELQSLNEEMVTVNAELQGKIDELSHANDDMKNLLDSTKIGIVFLDQDLCIKRFTSEATKIINLIPGDVGRPISHIVSNLQQDSLAKDARQVLDSLAAKERAVRTRDGRTFLNSIIPYRTMDHMIDGVVMTFTDITEQATILDARNLAEGVVETVREPLMVLDGDLRVVAANTAFQSLFKTSSSEMIGQAFFELGERQWDTPKLRELMEEVLPRNSQIDEFPLEHNFPKIGRKKLTVNARRIHRQGIGTETILLTIKEVTTVE